MKLSEMNTQELAVCLCKIAEPVEALGKSKKVNELHAEYAKKVQNGEDCTAFAQVTQFIGSIVPAFLCEESLPHTVRIILALTGKSEGEIMAQSGAQTVKDIKDCLDDDLIRFFTSYAHTEPET